MQQDFAKLRDRWRKNLAADIDFAVVIHSGSVEVHAAEGGASDDQAMDALALTKLLGEVTAILQSRSILKNGIAVSETTADGLRGTLPLGDLPEVEIPDTAGDSGAIKRLALHSVEMPLQDAAPSLDRTAPN